MQVSNLLASKTVTLEFSQSKLPSSSSLISKDLSLAHLGGRVHGFCGSASTAFGFVSAAGGHGRFLHTSTRTNFVNGSRNTTKFKRCTTSIRVMCCEYTADDVRDNQIAYHNH